MVPRVGSFGPVLAASISDNGMLAYSVDGAFDSNAQLAWFDRGGKRLGEVGPPAAYREISLSPDGKRLAMALGEANNEQSIWLLDLGTGGVATKFTFQPTMFLRWMQWAPDGSRLLFTSNIGASGGIYEKPTNGTGMEKPIPGIEGFPNDWSRDGRFILSVKRGDLWIYTNGESTQITSTPFNENGGEVFA